MILIKNNIQLPDYVTENYLKKCLRKSIQSEFKIFEANATAGSKTGENYCSDIFRVDVKYEECDSRTRQTISLIIKHLAFKPDQEKVFNILRVYEKECDVYFNIVPGISELLRNEVFTPKCYYATDEPVKSIVLQDMNPEGYAMGNRESGLDEHHSKLLLKKLGRFHAASMVLLENNPHLIEKFSTGLLNPDLATQPLHAQFFNEGIKALANAASDWKNGHAIREKLLRINDNLTECLRNVANTNNDKIKVLNHGDCWVNNVLFKFDGEEQAKDVAFIDFQLSVYASPGMDINYFLNTSTQLDVIKYEREELIFTYYKSLKDTLEQLKYHRIPCFEEIKEEIRRKEFFGLIAAATILPLIKLDKENSKDTNLDVLMDEEQAKKTRVAMYSSKGFIEAAKHFLARFNDLGVLDTYNYL